MPCNGAFSTVLIESSITHQELCVRLANKLDIAPSKVAMGWKMSTSAQRDGFQHLSNNLELQEMIKAYQSALNERKLALARAKKSGKEVAKVHRMLLKIELKDLKPKGEGDEAKKKGKSKSAKGAGKAKKQVSLLWFVYCVPHLRLTTFSRLVTVIMRQTRRLQTQSQFNLSPSLLLRSWLTILAARRHILVLVLM